MTASAPADHSLHPTDRRRAGLRLICSNRWVIAPVGVAGRTLVTAAPLPQTKDRLPQLDLTLVTVLAVAWVAAAVATSLTLWMLVGFVGQSGG